MVLTLLAALSITAAKPLEPKPLNPLTIDWALDLPATATMASGWLVLTLESARLARPSCPCGKASLFRIDRFAVDSAWAPGAALANALAATLFVASGASVFASGRGARRDLESLLFVTESTLAAGFITEEAKRQVSRPFPYMYRASTSPSQVASGENYASFWSGHTATTMAAVVAALLVMHENGSWSTAAQIVAAIVGPLLAIGAGALEVSAGFHFPTDVAAGAVAGASTSFANFAIHHLGEF